MTDRVTAGPIRGADALGAAETVVVVPCYNEAARLDVTAFVSFLGLHPRISLLFVDDGSSDGTSEVLEEVRAASGRSAWMRLARNSGKAEAVRTGVLAALDAGATAVGYWDADLSTGLEAIPPMRDLLLAEPDRAAVLGSRVRLLGRRIERTPARHYLGRVFATVASLRLGLPIYDTQCGAKLFRGLPEVRAAFAEPFASRWIFDVELLARLTAALGPEAAQARIVEFPLASWIHVGGSKLRPGGILKAGMELLTLRLPR